MNKPDNYGYYTNSRNHIPYSQWPQEVKDYMNWKRRCRMKPEWANLSEEERREERSKIITQNRLKWQEKYKSMSDIEKAEINQKKGNWYNNLSEDEKALVNDELSKRSQSFWSNMSSEEHTKFSEYRWNLKSDEEKDIIIKRFNQAGVNRMKNMQPEDLNKIIHHMNDARLKKWHEDEKFRKEQIQLLRQHNEEYFNNLPEEEKCLFYERNGKRLTASFKEKWENDPEFKCKHIEFLRAHASDYYNSCNEEEKAEHNRKLQEANKRYLESLSPEERYELLQRNKLNIRFEKRFNESYISNEFYYQTEYPVTVDNITKYWDYAIYSKKTNNLEVVVDLDGEFYHGDSVDYNGLHSKEERDEKRGYFVPEGIKPCIISEHSFIEGFQEMIEILMENYDEFVNNLFKLYRSISFPYPQYDDKELINSYKQLLKLNPDNRNVQQFKVRNREGDKLISEYHRSIYHAHRHNCVSPYVAWNDDELLMKCIKNRILYRSILNPNKILQGFNVSKIAPKVSVFSAGRAKTIIYKYLYEFDEIFDPFSGFSGRMLGTISLGKRYIGQDISSIHINESKRLLQFLRNKFDNIPDVQLNVKDIFKSKGKYDCLFTCSPYSNFEEWKDGNTVDLECDDWIDICLERFNCKRYVFVVDKTSRYTDYISDIIVNRSHFGNNYEYIIVIDR